MKKCILLGWVILLLSHAPITAQITSFNTENNRVLFQLQNGSMIVSVCADNIIGVKYAAATSVPAKTSLAVIKNWEVVPFEVLESTGAVTLKTSKLTVVVAKADATVGFFTSDGTLILQEDSKQLIPQTVGTISTNACAATFRSSADEAIYGLGQHQQSVMNFKGKTQTLDQGNMEIALPVILSNKGYGLLWDNYSRTVFSGNVSSSTKYKFQSDAGDQVDYYFFYGPDADTIIAGYRLATGDAPLFPKWAYGLFQSMDKYQKSTDFYDVSSKYRKNRIPVDCIVQDWDYWDPYPWGSHKMNPANYPDPKLLVDSLHAMNLHTMISIWPVFTSGDANYTEFAAINALYPSNGTRHYYDAYHEQARRIYWRQMKEDLFAKYGWDAWWADSDEPDAFPDSYDRKALTTALGPGLFFNNAFPLMHTKGVYEGWRNDIPGKRMFTLSRSAFPGQQRYAAASWSGDIQSSWVDFKKQLPAGLNFSMSGIPYWTTDIGGYLGTDWTTQDNRELFTRWFEYGTFCPIFRIHGKLERTLYSETSWDAVTRKNLLRFDKLRYRLMPYIYSLAWKVTDEHYTIMRHLMMDNRTDPKVMNIDNQFMFGPSILVNPVADKGITSRTVYLPGGKWFDFWTGKSINGGQTVTATAPLDKIPVYIKAGAILPMGPDLEYANQSVDPMEIRVYKGANGQFNLYEDEGDTYNYEQGRHSIIPFSYDDSNHRLTIGNRGGSFSSMLEKRTFKIVWVDENYGYGGELPLSCDSVVAYTGAQVDIQFNPDKPHTTTHYEAEDATLSGAAEIAAKSIGYSGTGYVTGFNNTTSRVQFPVNVLSAGSYVVRLRYSGGVPDHVPTLGLSVNDLYITKLTCDKTVDWNSWSEVSYAVYLNAGNNTIAFNADSSAIALDCIDLILPNIPVPLNSTQKKIVRIRQESSNLYLDGKDGLKLGLKDNSSNSQFWVLESIDSKHFKISSEASSKCLTAGVAFSENPAPVILQDYSSAQNQQWLIDDYGYSLSRIFSGDNNKSISIESGLLVQDSDMNLPTQRWILEIPVSPGNGNGLLGKYFTGQNFQTLKLSRIDSQINFNWGLNAPDASMTTDNFSIRWTGQILPQYTDSYTFYTKSDDGVRLWVNDSLIISDWTARAIKENSGKIKLKANELYTIKLEYFDNAYDAIVSLEWACSGIDRQLVPQSQLFAPMTTGIQFPEMNQDEWNVYPNPTNSIVNVDFKLRNSSKITIDFLDSQGKSFRSISCKNQDTRLQHVSVDTASWPKGIYFVRIASNNRCNSKILCVK
ncbi:MAG: glycoside hydrolase family 31 protein [Bacteroidota bacterium]|nr:glycoside hydrolase family 31 protein [Bacteroidota bacterium]